MRGGVRGVGGGVGMGGGRSGGGEYVKKADNGRNTSLCNMSINSYIMVEIHLCATRVLIAI